MTKKRSDVKAIGKTPERIAHLEAEIATMGSISLEGLRPSQRARLIKMADGMRGWEPVGFAVDLFGDYYLTRGGGRERGVSPASIFTREKAEEKAKGERTETDAEVADEIVVHAVYRKGDEYDTERLEDPT